MKVSVIVPFYNRAPFIGGAVESLLDQKSDCDLDILVVDDGSTDEGPKIVAALAADNPEIRLIRTPNQGVASARNVGLQNLRPDCEFVTFLDSDDVSVPGRFASDLKKFQSGTDLDLTFGNITMTEEIDPIARAPAPGARFAVVRGIYLGAAIFRKTLIDRIGPFDDTFVQGEDTDYLLRTFESNINYLLTETNTTCYRLHPGNMTKDRDTGMRYLSRALYFSIARRRRDPNVKIPQAVFNMHSVVDLWGDQDDSL